MTIDGLDSNGFTSEKFSLRHHRNNKGSFDEILSKVTEEGRDSLPHVHWLEERGEDMTIKDFSRIFRWLRQKEREAKDPQQLEPITSPITQYPIPNTQYPSPNTQHLVLYQLIEKIRLYLSKKKKEAIIRIEDKSLGRLLVHIKVRSGKVSIRFVVTNPDTKKLIEENIKMLDQSFIGLGMELREFEVLVGRDEKGLMTEHRTGKLSIEEDEGCVFWSNNIIDYVA